MQSNEKQEQGIELDKVILIGLIIFVVAFFTGSYITEKSMLNAIREGELYTVTRSGCDAIEVTYNISVPDGTFIIWPNDSNQNTNNS